MVIPAAQATASGGEVASLNSRASRPSVGGVLQLPEPPHDHRAQAADVGHHAHRAPLAGRGQDRVADRLAVPSSSLQISASSA